MEGKCVSSHWKTQKFSWQVSWQGIFRKIFQNQFLEGRKRFMNAVFFKNIFPIVRNNFKKDRIQKSFSAFKEIDFEEKF